MRLRVKKYNNIPVVESYKFYHFLGLRSDYHSKWIRKIITLGDKGVDYFELNAPPDTLLCKNIQHRYLFSLKFAIGVCLNAESKEAIQLRRELIRIEEDIIAGREVLNQFTPYNKL